MENSRIDLGCYWNNQIKKQLSGVFELVFRVVERNFRKTEQKSSTIFEK